jgi:hypothetical protein
VAFKMPFTDDRGSLCPESVWVGLFQATDHGLAFQHGRIVFFGWASAVALAERRQPLGQKEYVLSGAWYWLMVGSPPGAGATLMDVVSAAMEAHALATADTTDPDRLGELISFFRDAEPVTLPTCWINTPDDATLAEMANILHPRPPAKTKKNGKKDADPPPAPTGPFTDPTLRFAPRHLKALRSRYRPLKRRGDEDERSATGPDATEHGPRQRDGDPATPGAGGRGPDDPGAPGKVKKGRRKKG